MRMARLASVAMVVWALVALRVLCTGGVILHPCTDCPEGELCGGECTCPDDPRNKTIVRVEDQGIETDVPVPVVVPSVASLSRDPERQPLPPREGLSDPPRWGNLPFHASDVPLLI